MPRKISDRVVKILNTLYTREIGVVGIYMDQHIRTADLYPKLSKKLEQSAVEEMKHAEKLAGRIDYLGKAVQYEKHPVPKPSALDIATFLRQNIEHENDAVELYNEGIKICLEEGDAGSRLLMESILADEERHVNDSATMLELIEKFGDQYVVNHLV